MSCVNQDTKDLLSHYLFKKEVGTQYDQLSADQKYKKYFCDQ